MGTFRNEKAKSKTRPSKSNNDEVLEQEFQSKQIKNG
jgi:hypothetical protein